MKKQSLIPILVFALLGFSACRQNNTTQEALDDESLTELPNKSDKHFEAAFNDLADNDFIHASMELREGAVALKSEEKKLKPDDQEDLAEAIGKIDEICNELDMRIPVEERRIRTAVANAELNVAHKYLITDDIYVLEEPDAKARINLHKNFLKSRTNLEKGLNNLKGDVKTEGQKLMQTTQSLETQVRDLENKMAEQTKKMDAFLAKNKPPVNS
ncbi:MAG: hypothetical protein KDD12_07125 [Lewinella sp.]|nr:hypothetical protein [Lewinella sp.]